MKRLYYILAIISALFVTETLMAQEPGNTQMERRIPRAGRGERTQERSSRTPELTVRAQDMNERMTQDIGNARWMRVIYREVDLTKEVNASLYYPLRPLKGSMNLFSTIFQLVSEDKIDVYEYLGDYEQFDEEYKVNFKEMLDRFYIYYETIPSSGGDTAILVNESDVPSADVRTYYVKEAWYFDQNNSVFDVKTLAICPILYMSGDVGEQRMPMFWVPYENIRPYITNTRIMTSNTNNAKTFTIDDYFRRRMFDGDIIKTENLMNLSLAEYYPDPDSLKIEQARIEAQLVEFERALYFQPDTTITDPKARRARARVQKASSAKEPKVKEQKVSAPKAERSAAPARSVRGRR
jgi:gliding motility associated protien GldN